MAYVTSTQIHMYPSAYRSGAKDKFAQLNTEFNLTNTKIFSSIDENNNYSYMNGEDLILYIHGYYFYITEKGQTDDILSFTHTSDNDILYAAIKTNVYNDIDSDVLVNYGTVTSTNLDVSTYFQGLCITDNPSNTGESTNLYYIKIAEWDDDNDKWIIVTQPLKLSTSEIRNGNEDEESIDNQFTTKDLKVNIIEKNTTNNITLKNTIIPDSNVYLGSTTNYFEKGYITTIDSSTINTNNLDGLTYTSNNATINLGQNGKTLTLAPASGATINLDCNNIYLPKAGTYFELNIDNEGIVLSYNDNEVAAFYTNNSGYGNISVNGTVEAASFRATSDIRLKENIKDFECKKSILDLPIKEFDFKETGQHAIGCIAQDLQEICPEIVHENEEGFLTIEENKLVYLLIQEVKKLKEEIENLK